MFQWFRKTSLQSDTGRAEKSLSEKAALSVSYKEDCENAENTEVIGSEQSKDTECSPMQPEYKMPPMTLLRQSAGTGFVNEEDIRRTASRLERILADVGVRARVVDYSYAPAVTRYELYLEQGTRINQFLFVADEIKWKMMSEAIRIEAPIPGKQTIGIEVPNIVRGKVFMRELIESEEYRRANRVSFVIGQGFDKKVIIANPVQMASVMVTGLSGSGKSMLIHTIILGLLYKAYPGEVNMILIDTRIVELSIYNGIPHLLIPVITDAPKAIGALHWAAEEMLRRCKKFSIYSVRDIDGYNRAVSSCEPFDKQELMSKIVIVIDEMIDLMVYASKEAEATIGRLLRGGRAAGIYLIMSTQRPSEKIVRDSFMNAIDSQIVLGTMPGTPFNVRDTDKLLGQGDMLFYPSGSRSPVRVQGAYVSYEEIAGVANFLKIWKEEIPCTIDKRSDKERDELFVKAAEFIIDKEKASIGNLQREFRIGFNRAARIMDQLADDGIVGPEEGTKPRKILMTMEEFEGWKSKLMK